MIHHKDGYIIDGPDILDIDLWRRRLRQDRLYYEGEKRRLEKLIETLRQRIKDLAEEWS